MSHPAQNNQGILLESGTNEVEFLQFSVGNQFYGINVAKVRQILSFTDDMITELPGEMESVAGLFYFREKPTPILDLRSYLKVKQSDAVNLRKLLIVTEINQHTTGFIIDQVQGIFRIKWTEFNTMESDLFSNSNVNVVGSVKLDETVILILDVESLLAEIIPSASLDNDAMLNKINLDHTLERKNVRILYCEDSTVVQKMLTMTLKKAGYEHIKVFSTGLDGLNFLKTQDTNQFDIVLSDIEMPKMDGLTFCKELRSIPHYKDLPLIFFSSMITDEMKVKCNAVGGNAAFSKPEIHKIISEIDRILKISNEE